jgi:hypothetical protein
MILAAYVVVFDSASDVFALLEVEFAYTFILVLSMLENGFNGLLDVLFTGVEKFFFFDDCAAINAGVNERRTLDFWIRSLGEGVEGRVGKLMSVSSVIIIVFEGFE